MFTGIVETCGQIESIHRGREVITIRIAAGAVTQDLQIGASVAVNGACLTVTDCSGGSFMVQAVPETLSLTNLGRLQAGDLVNLERAMRLGDRLDGHLVSGHVDGIGLLSAIDIQGEDRWLQIEAPPPIAEQLIPKGSVTIDGISLTVAAIDHHVFSVTIVPHTWAVTNLHLRRTGDPLNLEADLIGKYVQRLVMPYQKTLQRGN
ncbi:MAG: riboflavin synthase [Thermaerobacterales bacterium]